MYWKGVKVKMHTAQKMNGFAKKLFIVQMEKQE